MIILHLCKCMCLLFKLSTLPVIILLAFFYQYRQSLNSIYTEIQIARSDYVLYEDVQIITNPYKLIKLLHEIV